MSKSNNINYEGMTVNERLFKSGIIDEFEKAVKNKNKQKVKQLLESINLSENNIINIIKKTFNEAI